MEMQIIIKFNEGDYAGIDNVLAALTPHQTCGNITQFIKPSNPDEEIVESSKGEGVLTTKDGQKNEPVSNSAGQYHFYNVDTDEYLITRVKSDIPKNAKTMTQDEWRFALRKQQEAQAEASNDVHDVEEETQEVDYDALRKEARQLGIKLVKDKKRDEVKALTAKYGAEAIDKIADDKIITYLKELREL